MKKICVLAILALVAATGAAAADPVQADAPKREKPICKTEKLTGSRTRVNRICMTKAEWDLLAAETKKNLDTMGRGASGGMKIDNPMAPPGN